MVELILPKRNARITLPKNTHPKEDRSEILAYQEVNVKAFSKH